VQIENTDSYNKKYLTAKGALFSDKKFSVREIIYRLFFRFWLFLFCVLFIPLAAISMVHIIPPTYKATSKIIIKRNNSVTPYFNEIATPHEQIISGQSNVEIIRSLPICEKVVEKLGLKSSDIAKPAYKILMSHLARIYYLFKNSIINKTEQSFDSDVHPKTLRLAEELKDTITPRLIQKGRNALIVKDELIEIEVKSFNREKVAPVTNTLSNEFIDEFYRIYENEAARAYDYLTKQIEVTKKQIIIDTKTGGKLSGKDWTERNINSNPIVTRIARQVAELEKELFRLENVYAANSPEVKKARAELNEAKTRLENHKATESAETILNVLTEKRRTAYMTLQLYKNRLIPISIIEKAVTPKKSSIIIAARYGIAGCLGLISGVLTGFILVMFFSALDNRLSTPWDIERYTDLEVIGSIRESKEIIKYSLSSPSIPIESADNAIMNMLGMLDIIHAERGSILLVTSPARHEGKTTIAFQTAAALARDKRAKTLLIDADFKHPDLSRRHITHTEKLTGQPRKGMVDVLVGDVLIEEVITPCNGENFDIVCSGTDQVRKQMGFYKKSLRKAFDALRERYDLIVVDGPGILASVDAALFASEADSVVLVIKAGETRLETINNATSILKKSGIKAAGAILNHRKFPVPRLFYG
jgi:capsular exopolysaccharide synthesis family protein